MRVYRVETTKKPPGVDEPGWCPPGEVERVVDSVEGPDVLPWTWPRDRNYLSAGGARSRLTRLRRWGGQGRILRSTEVRLGRLVRRPWWLFYGVAAETERMRYRGPWERLALAFQEGLMPVFRQLQQTFKEVGRAFVSFGVSVSPPR